MENEFLEGSRIDKWRKDSLEHTDVFMTRGQALQLWVWLLYQKPSPLLKHDKSNYPPKANR